jgi:hypothetical protein
MIMDKIFFVNQYKRLKDLNSGQKPLYREFLKFCNAPKRKLDEVFGKDAYTKLQEECGDNPNKLSLERTPLTQIYNQYGELVRKINGVPVMADWFQAKLKPNPDGLSKVHNLKWKEMPSYFIKEYSHKPEWKDVIEILSKKTVISIPNKKNNLFNEIVDKIAN